jgi:hypothetical protein
MKPALRTYSLNLHGIGQDWAGFKWPWPWKWTLSAKV